MILSNASPLIYLTKLDKLNIMKGLFKEIIIPKQVYEEVIVRGNQEKFFDALRIDRAVQDGWVKVHEIKTEKDIEKFAPELDSGEIALISLARELKPSLILVDDASARTIAESFGFNVKGTLFVLIKAYKLGLIGKNETRELINRLVFHGFRISQEIYIQLLSEIDKL